MSPMSSPRDGQAARWWIVQAAHSLTVSVVMLEAVVEAMLVEVISPAKIAPVAALRRLEAVAVALQPSPSSSL